jgi:hypothetical protein
LASRGPISKGCKREPRVASACVARAVSLSKNRNERATDPESGSRRVDLVRWSRSRLPRRRRALKNAPARGSHPRPKSLGPEATKTQRERLAHLRGRGSSVSAFLAGQQRFEAGSADAGIRAGPAVQRVVTGMAHERVVTFVPQQGVVPAVPAQNVIAVVS